MQYSALLPNHDMHTGPCVCADAVCIVVGFTNYLDSQLMTYVGFETMAATVFNATILALSRINRTIMTSCTASMPGRR